MTDKVTKPPALQVQTEGRQGNRGPSCLRGDTEGPRPGEQRARVLSGGRKGCVCGRVDLGAPPRTPCFQSCGSGAGVLFIQQIHAKHLPRVGPGIHR